MLLLDFFGFPLGTRATYPPKERFLRTLSEGSLWFECSLLLYVIVGFFGFPLGTRATYCVVGGGWGVFLRNIKKNIFFKKTSSQ